jgi:hypothetical protein
MGQLELHYGIGEFILKRRDSKRPRFYLVPKGFIKHAFEISTMKFMEQNLTKIIEGLNINRFEDADFMKVGVPAPP